MCLVSASNPSEFPHALLVFCSVCFRCEAVCHDGRKRLELSLPAFCCCVFNKGLCIGCCHRLLSALRQEKQPKMPLWQVGARCVFITGVGLSADQLLWFLLRWFMFLFGQI